MAKFHIRDNGEPGRCDATEGACPLGGEHFSTPDAAREAYESDMREIGQLKGVSKHETLSLEQDRKSFFNQANEVNYTLIDVDTGTVFSANSVVMELPEDEEGFYEEPTDFTELDEVYNVQPIVSARSLSSYKNPVIVELDTDLIVGANPKNLYAINMSKEIIDFDEILDSSSSAAEAAETQGFQIWD